MLSTLETVLLAAFFGVSTALFVATIVLAILHHYRWIPRTYINQYNANPTVNYVVPQQPPLARIHSPICGHRPSEIHELSGIRSQRATEDVASTDESIPENRIDTHPGTPVILLSLTSSSSALSSKSTPYVIRYPSPIAAPDLAERLRRFQIVRRSIARSPSPYPINLSSDHTRVIPTAEPAAFNPDNLWDSITPSAFLSVSAFIPSREPHIEDPDYPTIINWDQPIPYTESDPVSATIHSAWQEVEAPVTGPS